MEKKLLATLEEVKVHSTIKRNYYKPLQRSWTTYQLPTLRKWRRMLWGLDIPITTIEMVARFCLTLPD